MSSAWIVTWRAIDPHGAPDRFGAIRVAGAAVTTVAQAIHSVQTYRGRVIRQQFPGRALVDWKATRESEKRKTP